MCVKQTLQRALFAGLSIRQRQDTDAKAPCRRREIWMKSVLAALLLMLSTLATPVAATAQPLQASIRVDAPVFVIRHLQKGEGADPSLTSEGKANAMRLVS